MSACDPQTFDEVVPAVWALLRSEVQNQLGIVVNGAAGEASARGFTIAWNYDERARRLTLTCVEKPFFVPCGMINGQIGTLIDRAKNGA